MATLNEAKVYVRLESKKMPLDGMVETLEIRLDAIQKGFLGGFLTQKDRTLQAMDILCTLMEFKGMTNDWTE